MTIDQYSEYILTLLGAPTLNIEIEDQLPKIIETAFLELREYIDTPHYQTVPIIPSSIGSSADLSEYKVRAILYVMRGNMSWVNTAENRDALLWSPISNISAQSQNMGYSKAYSQMDFLKDYSSSLRYRQLRNTISQDLDFTYDAVNQKLYIFQQIPQSQSLTIVYNKRYEDVEEVTDPFWTNLFLRLATAYTKQVLGRIRGKYKMASAPYELDADTLLAEANSELTEIRTFLNDNNNIFIPRD